MPVVRFSRSRLEGLVGRPLGDEELGDLVFRVKGEVESLSDEQVELEVTSDRPDLLMPEGLARALRGLLGVEAGLPRLRISGDTGIVLRVERVPSRPYIGVAVVYDYPLSGGVLEELIQFQEKLHVTVGRKRRKVAIGIHDLDKLPSPHLVYREARLDERMTPLHTGRAMSIAETLSQTEQGREYGRISLRDDSLHPAIFSGGEIISLPPVINSDVTRLETGTRNLLIDVTGTDREAVYKTLDLLTSTLAERRPAAIGRIRVELPSGDLEHHPLLERGTLEASVDYVNRSLGTSLTGEEAIERLERMRWEAHVDGERIRATYPEYRLDILHPIDLVEDIAMAQGYDRLPLTPPREMLRPREDPLERLSREASELAAGLGFMEMHTFTLVPSWINEEYLPPRREPVGLVNPISAEMAQFRASMVPSLLLTLRESQGARLPLRIHEVGTVATVSQRDGALEETLSLGMAVMDDSVSFEDIQAPIYALVRALGLRPSTEKRDHPGFIRGRSANLLVNSVLAGRVGEVSPAVLERLGIKYPVAVAELDLSKVLGFL